MDNLQLNVVFTQPETNQKIIHREIINGKPQQNTLFKKPLGWKQSIHLEYSIDGNIEKIDDTKWWVSLLSGIQHNTKRGTIINGKLVINEEDIQIDNKVLLVNFETTSKLILPKDLILEYKIPFHFDKPENCHNQNF